MSRVGVAFLVVAIVVVVERRSSGIDIDAERWQYAHLDGHSSDLDDMFDQTVLGRSLKSYVAMYISCVVPLYLTIRECAFPYLRVSCHV